MKNVFKRCIKVITLFDTFQQDNIDSTFIKDNIPRDKIKFEMINTKITL